VQGDKDKSDPRQTRLPHEEKAEAIDAPTEVLIVKNGHNLRKVDADINPTRDEIVERTVAFLVEHLK
jgi:hypothetical protein